jgi:SAM-dependent methyltransferase
MFSDPNITAFFQRLQQALDEDSFVKLVCGQYAGDEPGLLRVLVQPVRLKNGLALSLVSRYATRDITKNVSLQDAVPLLRSWAGERFKNFHLLTRQHEAQLRFSKKGKALLHVHATTSEPDSNPTPDHAHNREKHRYLSLQRPFLSGLGVTDAQGTLIPAMARKWKQINKFIEVFEHALRRSALIRQPRLRIMDFGAGKGYLTFALYDYLQNTVGIPVAMTGVELRHDLVNHGNRLAEHLQYQGLRFEQGNIQDYPVESLDVMVALHACDTATDIALYKGIRSGAGLIVCAPCCHKQIRPQLLSPHPLRPILQHGVHLGQEAEMITDSLRALLLETCGYEAQVFEFIALEHTQKNKMILGVKAEAPSCAPDLALEKIRSIKDFYGLKEQALEQLLSSQ